MYIQLQNVIFFIIFLLQTQKNSFTDFIKNYPDILNRNTSNNNNLNNNVNNFNMNNSQYNELSDLKNKNKDLLNDNNELRLKISQLNNTITQLNNQIDSLTIKNKQYENDINRLSKEKKNLENQLKNIGNNNIYSFQNTSNQKEQMLFNLMNDINIKNNEIAKKNKELSDLKSMLPFDLKEGEHLIPVIFISGDENMYYSLICKNTEKFNSVENRLYDIYPDYQEGENCFYINGNKITKSKTLDENGIKYSDIIMMIPVK